MNPTKTLTKKQLIDLYQLVDTIEQRFKYNQFDLYFPDEGEFSRDKYPKYMDALSRFKVADLIGVAGANGVGKSLFGCYVTYCHLSGKYPDWWKAAGYFMFTKPISAWCAAREAKQLRDSFQETMFGKNLLDAGTGIIPRDAFLDADGKSTIKQLEGSSETVGMFKIKHYDANGTFDGYSSCQFKRYSQGWQEFQGSNRDWIWLDEEADDPRVLSECFLRLRGPKGHTGKMLVTFAPLLGAEICELFIPGGVFPPDGIHPDDPKTHTIQISWDDVPHLDEEYKASAIAKIKLTDPHLLEARTKAIPPIGSGRIYPVSESEIVVQPFKIPDFWPRAYGLDFGHHRFAVLWAAQDPNTKCIYLYTEYVKGGLIAALHVANIQAKGKKIPGACDPSGGGRNENGRLIADVYRTLGLNLVEGSNDASMRAVILNMLETGMLKIFATCQELLKELRVYKYDMKNPNIPQKNQKDDLLDALKYLLSQFEYIAKSELQMRPQRRVPKKKRYRDPITGY